MALAPLGDARNGQLDQRGEEKDLRKSRRDSQFSMRKHHKAAPLLQSWGSRAWGSPRSTERLLSSLCSPRSPWPTALRSLVGRSHHKLQVFTGIGRGRRSTFIETPGVPRPFIPHSILIAPPTAECQAQCDVLPASLYWMFTEAWRENELPHAWTAAG